MFTVLVIKENACAALWLAAIPPVFGATAWGGGPGAGQAIPGQLPRCSAGLSVGALHDEVSRNGIT
jgi:hypothetical protein